VKKIISILVALGVILGLTLGAAPVAAQVDCPDDCTANLADLAGPPDFCAGKQSIYDITDITLPVTLIGGTDSLSVTFPVGTDLSSVDNTDIYIYSHWYITGTIVTNPTDVTITDNYLEFVVPVNGIFWLNIPAGTDIDITVSDVVNPPAGDYCLFVDYKLACCDPVDFDCVPYTVVPAIATLGFHYDFSPTYTGLAEDFIPPFKACGQECYGTYNSSVGWLTDFDLILREDVPGCAPPCASADMWFELTACPAGETITFNFDGDWFILTALDVGKNFTLPNVALSSPVNISWPCMIHFSSPGEYELCFYLECPEVPCAAGKQIVAEKCMPCKAYQWKEAHEIPLYRKWNLICLPLVPLVDPPIDDMLDACTFKDEIMSIWYYDRCEDYPEGQWYVWPTPDETQEALTELVDGKSYWVRVVYNSTHPAGQYVGPLWTWGTRQPTPPASPSAYAVCEGWNMVGLTGYGDGWWTKIRDEDYLWNWFDNGWPEYGGIYGWDPNGYTWAGPQAWWSVTPVGNWLPKYYTGEGYWISFEHDGTIYPP
jgi:hypothetical protein